MDREEELLLWIMGFVIVIGVAIVLIFGEKPVDRLEPGPACPTSIAGDCCISPEEFMAILEEQCEGGG